LNDAIIGATGYVGTTLLRQRGFAWLYRSTNIDDIGDRSFDLVICAGAPAQKWIANRDPVADREHLAALMAPLRRLRCQQFVLISTVDVFKTPINVDEESAVEETGLAPYGLHRRELEKFVQDRFPAHMIVRLPGLVGPGLRKNVIFDLHHDNDVAKIDGRGVFQFYPMVNLWPDLNAALHARLHLIHLTAEPISVQEVAAAGFGRELRQATSSPPARYDLRTRHAALCGGSGHYHYSKRDTILAVRAYAQSEPRRVPREAT
jgi:nucleoside-diphosphate-sugar epimerase